MAHPCKCLLKEVWSPGASPLAKDARPHARVQRASVSHKITSRPRWEHFLVSPLLTLTPWYCSPGYRCFSSPPSSSFISPLCFSFFFLSLFSTWSSLDSASFIWILAAAALRRAWYVKSAFSSVSGPTCTSFRRGKSLLWRHS